MLKRIEFSLNLNDPHEARIYRALLPSLRYRRGGSVIRQALGDFFDEEETHPTAQAISVSRSHIQEKTDDGQE
jgi:hypothetical protein